MSLRAISLNGLAEIGHKLLLVGAACFLLVYLIIAVARLAYPFELEWMEGGSVLQVQRILQGQSLYVAPSLNFIPFIYTPLYFYVSALVAQVTGDGFFPLRLVSFLSSLGCFAFIFMMVRRRTASLSAACLATGLFAATFRISGAWFDIARVDSLFLCLLLAGLYTFDSTRVPIRTLVSPALLFLAFFTKQTALIIAAGLCVAVLLTRKGPERYGFLLSFLLLMAGSFVIMNALTAGWYKYYVFDLPAQHHMVKSVVVSFWIKDIAQHLAIALCVGVVPFVKIGTATDARPGRLVQDLIILGSLFLASYLVRIEAGGYDNVLMPAYAGMAIYFGIGWAAALKAVGSDGNVKSILILAVALQFVSLVYWPRQQIPSAQDREQGRKLEQVISSLKGEVYLSDHPWYTEKLHKPSQAQTQAVLDILLASGSGPWKQALAREMAAAVAARRYEAFIVDSQEFALRTPAFDAAYELAESNLCGNAFHPVTGCDRKPTCLYVRRPAPQNASADIDKPRR